jgi:Leucine-rich repeat (LRR) protein
MAEKRERLTIITATLIGLSALFSCTCGKENGESVSENKGSDTVVVAFGNQDNVLADTVSGTPGDEADSGNTGRSLPYSKYWTTYNSEEDVLDHVFKGMNDLSWFYGNEDISSLELWRGEYTDLRPLTTMKNLERLCLFNNTQISDISPLAKMINLKRLEIVGCNRIEDYAPIASLENTNVLRIDCDLRIDFDATYVSSLVNLQDLDLVFMPGNITNISLLENLVHLKKLRIGRETIESLGWIKNLRELEHLALEESAVGDVSPLLSLPKLEFVSFDYSTVENIMPLIESTSIKRIWEPEYKYDENFSENDKYFYRVVLNNKFYERGISLGDPHEH